MRRLIVMLLGIGGCTFAPQPTSIDKPATPPQPVGPPPSSAGCSVSDSSLELCLDFEDSSLEPTALDTSGAHTNATTSHVSAMPRGREQAMHLTAQSTASVPLTISTTPMSFEMYVSPDTKGMDDELIAGTDTYGLVYDHDGSVSVTFGGDNVWTDENTLPAGAWSHVGWVADDDLRLYLNGDLVACTSLSDAGPIAIGQLHLGGTVEEPTPFVGGVDNVHLYGSALSSDTMCARAGRTRCNSDCPGEE